MKSILERALVHLLNEENEKAEELLHQFVIETARNIHETLREGDEAEIDAELEEEFFTEADLDMGGDIEDAAADLGDDLGDELPAEAGAEDMADDTLDADMGVEGDDLAAAEEAPAGEGDIEAEIENFEQELADLQAKFDAMLAEIEGEDDVADEGDDMGAEDFGGEDVADEAGEEIAADDAADFGGDEEALGDEDLVKESEDEDFDDITESVVDELQKVAAIEAEGKGATGQDLLGNKQSPKFRKPEAKGTNAQSSARVGHTGWARETAPASTALKGGKTTVNTSMKNVRNDADAGNHKVTSTSEGPKASIRARSKDEAHAKGPISGKPIGKK